MHATVSVLGMGRMGSALARAFLASDLTTTVWNRTPHKCTPLGAEGARVAESLPDAVRASPIVISVLHDYACTDALLRTPELSSGLRGKLWVQLASGSARQARETAAWARAHEIAYLDGAIMATPDFIGKAECTILYAGHETAFAGARSTLARLGGGTRYVGSDPGHASALDSALLVFMWGQLFGLLQGLAVCEAEGLSLDAFSEHLAATIPVVNGALNDTIQRVQRRSYAADQQTLATLGAHYGAFRHLLETCRDHDLPSVLPDAMAQLFEAAIANGHADDDFAVLHTFMRPGQSRPLHSA